MSNTLYTLIARARPALVAFALGAAVSGVLAWASQAQSQNIVSQKGRQFQPSELTLKQGETVLIVNDDADLRHHAYVDSAKFKFDSGDQEPGSKTPVRFSVAGTFEVLCAIHPKMKLTVHVN
ncbi:MAG TPA: plastocyanin/azurin family copper-binding protein [Pseudolabrys sp.]|nr:plastocyanin/azurin family copper-binding protein [Pseudolabrys sp.]